MGSVELGQRRSLPLPAILCGYRKDNKATGEGPGSDVLKIFMLISQKHKKCSDHKF